MNSRPATRPQLRSASRLIPSEELTDVTRWDFEDVNAEVIDYEQQAYEAEQQALALEKQSYEDGLRKQGHEEGYSEGYATGFEQGKAQGLAESQRQLSDYITGQGQQIARQFAGLMASAGDQMDMAEQLAAQSVLEIACELARQVLRSELVCNPNALLPVVREALGQLFADIRAATVRLHPLDLDVLQDALHEEFPNLKLTLQPDATLTRGGCVVEAAGTVIDGRLEKRWQRAVNRLGQNTALDDKALSSGAEISQEAEHGDD